MTKLEYTLLAAPIYRGRFLFMAVLPIPKLFCTFRASQPANTGIPLPLLIINL
jgi:hypothetical protein